MLIYKIALHSVTHNGRIRPARCRSISEDQEIVLPGGGSFPQIRKSSSLGEEVFHRLGNHPPWGREFSTGWEIVLPGGGSFPQVGKSSSQPSPNGEEVFSENF
jgi:hypothetical protein